MAMQNYESKSHPYGTGKSSEFGRHLDMLVEITHEQRDQMIAEAAYYIAEHRHFKDGDPVHDWLTAQKEIDSKIKRAHR